MKINKVLITGATGFVGSSLAARFLREGKWCLALSRHDPEGRRTRSAIEKAARTLGFTLSLPLLNERLTVLEHESYLSRVSDASELSEIESAWHCAAMLTYDPEHLRDSIDVNIGGTARLYEHLLKHSTQCRRFYHISTAYCVGLPQSNDLIPEDLHSYPHHPNIYQLSKWGAEMALRNLSLDSSLPVSILRPSVVVGNQRSGNYHGEAFGIYMFFQAGHHLIRAMGIQELGLSTEINGSINLIPIDVLVQNLSLLAERENALRPGFEVIHCTGQNITAENVARCAEKVLNIAVSFSGPRNEWDERFAMAVKENQIFAKQLYHFEQRRLSAILGADCEPVNINDDTLIRMIQTYMKRLDLEISR